MMVRAAAFALVLLMQQPAPPAPATPQTLAGDTVKATIRMSIARIDVEVGAAASPYAAFGPLLAQMLTPEGPVDIRYTVTGDAMRAEIDGRLAAFPRGTVVLQKVGQPTIQILNLAQKTWYEVPFGQNLGALLGTPDVDIQPTKEQATIAGQRADRFTFIETLHVPSQGTALPPDFPKEIQLTGDLWSTDTLSDPAYRTVGRTLQTFAALPGIDALTANGRFPLKLAVRSPMLAGFELRTEVTSLVKAAADPAAFTVPSDFQKVQSPGGGE